jgi:hypothetical protein
MHNIMKPDFPIINIQEAIPHSADHVNFKTKITKKDHNFVRSSIFFPLLPRALSVFPPPFPLSEPFLPAELQVRAVPILASRGRRAERVSTAAKHLGHLCIFTSFFVIVPLSLYNQKSPPFLSSSIPSFPLFFTLYPFFSKFSFPHHSSHCFAFFLKFVSLCFVFSLFVFSLSTHVQLKPLESPNSSTIFHFSFL